MSIIIKLISSSLVGGGVGAVIADRFNMFRDRRNRIINGKDAFLNVLAEQRAKLYAITVNQPITTIEKNSASEDTFFDNSVNALAFAVFKVQPFVTESQWSCLQAALKDYQSQKSTNLGADRLISERKAGESYSQKLNKGLDKFYDCITNTN